MQDIYKILLFSLITYVYLFVVAKILGKKQISQLSFIDYVVGITLGSIGAEMTTDLEQPFYHYLIAMTAFVLFDFIVTLVGRKGTVLKKILAGKPLILISDGKLQPKEVSKSKLTVDEIAGLARDKGFFDISQIAYAILETSGKLSVLPKSNFSPLTVGDAGITKRPATLTDYVIIDGKVRSEALSRAGIDEQKLLDMLTRQGLTAQDVLVAVYDAETDTLDVHRK